VVRSIGVMTMNWVAVRRVAVPVLLLAGATVLS
jgi:hypothetical protein